MKVFREKENQAILINEEKFLLVKKVGKKGDVIQKHNHPDKNIIFTLIKGSMELTLDSDTLTINEGDIVNFDGNKTISAKYLEDSQATVTLILK